MPFIVPQGALPRPLPGYNQNPVYHQPPPAAPIHLSGSLLLQPGTSGSVQPSVMTNPMGQDMEVTELKFQLLSLGNSGFALDAVLGASIAVELKLGNYKLTNGAVPVFSLGRAENLTAEYATLASLNLYNTFSWRLPRPMFVPAGATVIANFTHTGLIALPINVRFSMSARSLFIKPKVVCLPWASAFTSKVFNPLTTAGTDQSGHVDLVNDSTGFEGAAQILKVQRFVGRAIVIQSGDHAYEGPTFGAAFREDGLTVRMMDSYGRPTVRYYTPFTSVFSGLTRSWELEGSGVELDPGAYYLALLKSAALPGIGGFGYTGIQGQAFISLIGWREVAL
jgi:hypothetical protein